MAEIIPAFPLSIVPFPGEEINLHIFESRYKSLINECVDLNKSFCLLPIFEDKDKTYGTEMVVIDVAKRYKDGKLDIRTKGVNLMKIITVIDKLNGKLYPGVEYEKLYWDDVSDLYMNIEIVDLLEKLFSKLSVQNIKLKNPSDFRTYQVGHKVGFNIDQELEFLALQKEVERQRYMLAHLVKFLPIIDEMNSLKEKAKLNGYFKPLPPMF